MTATVVAALLLARRQPLSWDEAVTVAVATRPLPAMIGTIHHSDAVLGLYYALMHAWNAGLTFLHLRPTEVWWRLPSAVAAVATAGVVASCAGRSGGRVAALCAGGALVVSPLFGFYTVDARPYTLAALAVTSAWWAWTTPGDARPLHKATATGALLVLGAWLQLFTVLVWPAFLLVGGRSRLRAGLLTLGAATVGVVPLLAVALTQSSEIAWIPRASVTTAAGVALHVVGGPAVVVTFGAFLAVARYREGLPRSATARAALWWVAAPFAVLAALDTVRPVLVARYALVSLPMAAIGFGVVVARMGPSRRRRAATTLAVASVVAATATSAWQDTRPFKYENYRAAAAFATHAVVPGTPVLFAPSSARLGFDLYPRASALADVALPGGVGRDPLDIVESPSAVVERVVDRNCDVVVVGDPITVARPVEVSGWSPRVARGFGQVTVTVLGNPACRDGRPAPHDPGPLRTRPAPPAPATDTWATRSIAMLDALPVVDR